MPTARELRGCDTDSRSAVEQYLARLTSQRCRLAVDEQQWPGEWMRGVLALCVLAVVAEQERTASWLVFTERAAGLLTSRSVTA